MGLGKNNPPRKRFSKVEKAPIIIPAETQEVISVRVSVFTTM